MVLKGSAVCLQEYDKVIKVNCEIILDVVSCDLYSESLRLQELEQSN